MKFKIAYLTIFTCVILLNTGTLLAQNNIGIGTITPNAKALLDLTTNNDKGLLVPRVTTAERIAINPTGNADAALLVYDSNDNLFYFWNSTQWVPFPLAGGSNNISLNYDANTGILSLTDVGGTLTANFPPDNDSDPNNELITGVVFNANGNILTINEGSNTWSTAISIVDPDSDPTNEIQQLTLNNNILNLSISNNNVNLTPYLDNTDNQTLSLSGNSLSISNGNSVVLPQLPPGIIFVWSGQINNIPQGWALCDGTNGAPDLRDRFIVGARFNTGGAGNNSSNYNIGQTGGTNTVNIATANLPSHTHAVDITSTGQNQNHFHSGTTEFAGTHSHGGNTTTTGAHTHTQRYSQNSVTIGGGANVSDNGGQSATKFTGNPPGTPEGAHSNGINADGNHQYTFTTGVENVVHTHRVIGDTGATGSGTAIDTRPCYYALAFIIKL